MNSIFFELYKTFNIENYSFSDIYEDIITTKNINSEYKNLITIIKKNYHNYVIWSKTLSTCITQYYHDDSDLVYYILLSKGNVYHINTVNNSNYYSMLIKKYNLKNIDINNSFEIELTKIDFYYLCKIINFLFDKSS